MAEPQTNQGLLQYRLAELEKNLEASDKAFADFKAKEFAEFKASMDAKETKYLVRGIVAMGAAVSGLVGVLYSLLTTGHIK